MDALGYIRQAHAMAAAAADEQAVNDLTVLIDGITDPDSESQWTTEPPDTTDSKVDVILRETGIAYHESVAPEQAIITEITRLRGELHALQNPDPDHDDDDTISEDVPEDAYDDDSPTVAYESWDRGALEDEVTTRGLDPQGTGKDGYVTVDDMRSALYADDNANAED